MGVREGDARIGVRFVGAVVVVNDIEVGGEDGSRTSSACRLKDLNHAQEG